MIHLRGAAARAALGIVAVEDFMGRPGMLRGKGPFTEQRARALAMLADLKRGGTLEFMSEPCPATCEIWIDDARHLDAAERLGVSLANLLHERVGIRAGAQETLLMFCEPR